MDMVLTIQTPGFKTSASKMRDTTPLMKVLGKQLETDLRDHFAMRDAQGNSRGFPRRHFWSRQVRMQTAMVGATNNSAWVSVASPEFMHKLTGGRIVPKKGKALAIPISAEAYKAWSPKEFDDLKYIPINRAPVIGMLVRQVKINHMKLAKGQKRAISGGERMYLLMRYVDQSADPNALPPPSQLSESISKRAASEFRRLLRNVS